MVAPNSIRKLLNQNPFVPLQFHLRDGSVLNVVEAGRVFLPPNWSQLLVTDSKPERFDFVPLSNVKEVTIEDSANQSAKSPKRKE